MIADAISPFGWGNSSASMQFDMHGIERAKPVAVVRDFEGYAIPANPEAMLADQLIEEIAALSDDWDGYGAAAIDPVIHQRARRFFQAFAKRLPVPSISPNSHGTISFDWIVPRGEAHFEIGLNDVALYLTSKHMEPLFLKQEVDVLGAEYIANFIAERLFPASLHVNTVQTIQLWRERARVPSTC